MCLLCEPWDEPVDQGTEERQTGAEDADVGFDAGPEDAVAAVVGDVRAACVELVDSDDCSYAYTFKLLAQVPGYDRRLLTGLTTIQDRRRQSDQTFVVA